MELLRSLSIGKRLALAFGAVLLLLALTGGTGALQITRVNGNAEDLATNWMPSVGELGELKAAINQVRRLSLRAALETDASDRDRTLRQHDEALSRLVAEHRTRYEALISSPEEKSGYEAFSRQWDQYLRVERGVIEQLQAARNEAALLEPRRQLLGTGGDRFNESLGTLDELIRLNVQGAQDAVGQARATYQRALLTLAALLAVAITVGLVLATVIARSIAGPIREAVQAAEAVAAGDLTYRVQVSGHDEATQMLQALRDMTARLSDVVSNVRRSSDSIAIGSREIATGNTDLSQRTETQASSLEETAASMEELTGIVKNNSEAAQQATQLAGQTSQAAEQGGAVVTQVVQMMHGITESSRKIADIIGVIDSIAFQTNILALNAAVEAARAGEQGRGFAVVASEVRTLAQRSADASKEIRQLIERSVNQVQDGSRLVDAAGQSMTDIVTRVRKVDSLIQEIYTASREQSQGISQVGDAVAQLDAVTQQNAALVEQSAAAAESLSQQAQVLATTVAQFRLDASAQPRSAALERKPRTAAPRPVAARAAPPALARASTARLGASSAGSADGGWETL